MTFTVTACHDAAAQVRYVHDSDVPGLRAEAATFEDLVAIIQDVTPDLAGDLSGAMEGRPEIPVCVQHLVPAKRAHAARPDGTLDPELARRLRAAQGVPTAPPREAAQAEDGPQRSSRATRLDVSQRLPPIACTSA